MSRSREGYLWTPSEATEGLETDSVQSSSPNIKDHYDVIVIGAGFAGLIAARDLSRKYNLNVLLIEARDRIGGRTWTAKALGEDLEMGGTWVHWAQPHLYAELHRYGLHRNLKASAGTSAPAIQSFTPALGVVEEVSIPDCGSTLERVAARVFSIDGLDSRALMPYPHDPLREPALWKKYDHLTIKDRLNALHDIPQRDKDLFESNTNTFGSAPGKDIGFVEGLRWYALGGHTFAGVMEMAGIYKIGNGGMTAFARAILEEYTGDRLFNTVVSAIRNTSRGIEVTSAHGQTFRAKALISTVPLWVSIILFIISALMGLSRNCLGDIKFDPPLSPLRQEAAANGHINKGAKIHFKLGQTLPGWFWTGDGYGNSSFLFAFSDHNGTKPSGPSGTWCIGFGYNGKLTDKKDSRHILEQFKKNIKSDADIEGYATHDWMNDPYAKGVWACWGPNSASKYLQELQHHHGRIVFASADWADGWRGFVDGAIEQGQTAVRETLKLVKEQATPKL